MPSSTWRTILGAVLAMTTSIASCEEISCEEIQSPSRPLVVVSGDDSHVLEADCRRIGSESEWSKIWLQHLGLKEESIYRPKMEVDFTRCEVIAVFGGKSENCTGYLVDSIVENATSSEIRLLASHYQSAGPDGEADQVTPFAFIVLPRTAKTILVMEDENTYLGQGPKWVRATELPAQVD